MQSQDIDYICLVCVANIRSFVGIKQLRFEVFGDLFHWRGWLPPCSLQTAGLYRPKDLYIYLATYIGYILSTLGL